MASNGLGSMLHPQGDVCSVSDVSYSHRVDDPAHYNWCIVPDSGADGVLYAAVAVLLGCLVSGKLSSVWILCSGALLELAAYTYNLRRFSNASAIWLGMHPPDLFFYTFLPPLLLDAAVRIEFFTFRKVAGQVMTFAVGAVIGMVAIMTPLFLYGFDLAAAGWHWSHAALFVCMIASTDVVAVTAVLKKCNGPETLAVLMEGESLFNDATSIVMFEVFLRKVRQYEAGTLDDSHFLRQLYSMGHAMVVMSIGGAVCGIVAGWITTKLMAILRVRGMPPPFEVCLSVGASYLLFYVANGPLHLSGVIAVVVFGIYGSATLKWEMTAAAANYDFPKFWDVASQLTNTFVFFFAGAACTNFFVRATEDLEQEGFGEMLAATIWRLPLIYITMLCVRALLIAVFSPMLNAFGAGLDWRGIVFVTIGGLRGALCLIMVQTVTLDMGSDPDSKHVSEKLSAVKAALALWTAGIVLCTLVINAPALTFVLRLTGLTKVSILTLQARDKARRSLMQFTAAAIEELQEAEDDLFKVVDWQLVRKLVDCSRGLKELLAPAGEETIFAADDDVTAPLDADTRALFTGAISTAHTGGLQHLADTTDEAQQSINIGASSATSFYTQPPSPRTHHAGVFPSAGASLLNASGGSGEHATNGAGAVLNRNAGSFRWTIFGSAAHRTRPSVLPADDAQQPGTPSSATSRARSRHAIKQNEDELDGEVSGAVNDVLTRGPSRHASTGVGNAPPPIERLRRQHSLVPSLLSAGSAQVRDASAAGNCSHSDEAGHEAGAVRVEGITAGAFDEMTDTGKTKAMKQLDSEAIFTVQTDRQAECFYPTLLHHEHTSQASRNGGTPSHPQRHASVSSAVGSGTGNVVSRVTDAAHGVVDAVRQPLLQAFEEADEDDDGSDGTAERVERIPGLRSEPYFALLSPDHGFIAPKPFSAGAKCASKGGPVSPQGSKDLLSPAISAAKPEKEPLRVRTWASKPQGDDAETGVAGRGRTPADHLARTGAFNSLEAHHLDALPATALGRLHAEMLAEARMRVLASLKRYFHRKRHEGLLSGNGLRMLDHACDTCMDASFQPIDVFSKLSSDFGGGVAAYLAQKMHLHVRQASLAAARCGPRWLTALVRYPLYFISHLLSTSLHTGVRLALEVSIEYSLGLSFALDGRALRGHKGAKGSRDDEVREALRAELTQQKGAVWNFILDRVREAPDRFRAVQTYRAAMAVMAYQRAFVHKLCSTGIVDESELKVFEEAIEANERALKEKGVAWDTPSVTASLRQVPFFEGVPENLFREVVLQGSLVKYSPGELIKSPEDTAANPEQAFVGVVVSGLATSVVTPAASLQCPAESLVPGGTKPCLEPSAIYVTQGSVFGLLSSITGSEMPGRGSVEAHRGSRSTIVFQIPKHAIDKVLQRALADGEDEQRLVCGLHCLAASQILDRFYDLVATHAPEAQLMLSHARVDEGGSPSVSARWASLAESVGHSSMSGRLRATAAADAVRAMWTAARTCMREGELLLLRAGEDADVAGSAVLVSGGVRRGGREGTRGGEGAIDSVLAPCVLLWADFEHGGSLHVQAGERGAALVVCDATREASLRKESLLSP